MKQKRKNISRRKTFIGMKPLESYNDIKREELEDLKKMTMKEAIAQTEILLRATKWMK